MDIERTDDRTAEYEGTTYYFCSGSCREFFREHPDRFIEDPLPHLGGLDDETDVRIPHVPYGRARGEFTHDIADPSALAEGDSVTFTRDLTEEDLRKFVEATGDTNAVHIHDEFAKQTRFGRRIVHGTLVSGLISAALACFPGLTIYLSQQLEFERPVDIGETLAATCTIVEALEDARYRLTTRIENAVDELVVHGTATVLIDDVPDL
jgi:acyl dehydratase/YHS domain-containing protein